MVDSPYSLYKLIVLYTLQKVQDPMTGAQLADLFLNKNYTSFFHLQQVLTELQEGQLITAETKDHQTFYTCSEQGKEMLSFFGKDISVEIRDEITAYLQDHAGELRETAQVSASYRRKGAQEYIVQCHVKEGETTLIDLQLSVPTEAAAQALVAGWKKKNSEAYASLMQILSRS